MQQNHSSELLIHEWAAVATVMGFIGMLAVSAYLSAPPLALQCNTVHQFNDNHIEVYVQGCVEKPGPQRIKRGAVLSEVIKNSKPLPEADLRRINLEAKARPNQVVKVPAKKTAAPRKRKSGSNSLEWVGEDGGHGVGEKQRFGTGKLIMAG